MTRSDDEVRADVEACWDPIQCCRSHIGDPFSGDDVCPCGACDGTGLGAYQRVF